MPCFVLHVMLMMKSHRAASMAFDCFLFSMRCCSWGKLKGEIIYHLEILIKHLCCVFEYKTSCVKNVITIKKCYIHLKDLAVCSAFK